MINFQLTFFNIQKKLNHFIIFSGGAVYSPALTDFTFMVKVP